MLEGDYSPNAVLLSPEQFAWPLYLFSETSVLLLSVELPVRIGRRKKHGGTRSQRSFRLAKRTMLIFGVVLVGRH